MIICGIIAIKCGTDVCGTAPGVGGIHHPDPLGKKWWAWRTEVQTSFTRHGQWAKATNLAGNTGNGKRSLRWTA